MTIIKDAIKKAVASRHFNGLITETFESALEQEKNAIKKKLNPFSVVVKDCFAVQDIRMTCASKMLENFIPNYTATIIQRLIDHGGCVVGKANLDGFGMGSTSTQSYFGPVKGSISNINELEKDWRIAGGSSGGCAVAVHQGFADVAIASDTGGSTRNPAAFHGIFGFKPSYGTLSRHGLVPLANSFDVPAIFATSATKCAEYYTMMAGADIMDSTSISPLPYTSIDLSQLRLGIPKEYNHPTLSPESLEAWKSAANLFRSAGCKVIDVELKHTDYSIVCYHILAETDIASNMARFDGVSFGHRSEQNFKTFNDLLAFSRTESLNDTIRRRIFVGNYYNVRENRGKYFQQAAKVRRLIKEDFDRAFNDVDVLLTPVTSHSAPYYSVVSAAKFKHRQRQDDYFTQPANMAGLPAISIPFSNCNEGLPIGVQLICNYLEDFRLLDIANKFCQLNNSFK
uniref:Glutamyl-tRNA(Gln) amidotransferase subunit A, mitochondrial n=1 Tax=Panagrolaimus sp. PS1159 TaxID=55785 RepID=A0AC35FVI4_9BILA